MDIPGWNWTQLIGMASTPQDNGVRLRVSSSPDEPAELRDESGLNLTRSTSPDIQYYLIFLHKEYER
jgi:hypothetical protein